MWWQSCMHHIAIINAAILALLGPYHIETSLLIYRANPLARFYMIGTFVVKELNH